MLFSHGEVLAIRFDQSWPRRRTTITIYVYILIAVGGVHPSSNKERNQCFAIASSPRVLCQAQELTGRGKMQLRIWAASSRIHCEMLCFFPVRPAEVIVTACDKQWSPRPALKLHIHIIITCACVVFYVWHYAKEFDIKCRIIAKTWD